MANNCVTHTWATQKPVGNDPPSSASHAIWPGWHEPSAPTSLACPGSALAARTQVRAEVLHGGAPWWYLVANKCVILVCIQWCPALQTQIELWSRNDFTWFHTRIQAGVHSKTIASTGISCFRCVFAEHFRNSWDDKREVWKNESSNALGRLSCSVAPNGIVQRHPSFSSTGQWTTGSISGLVGCCRMGNHSFDRNGWYQSVWRFFLHRLQMACLGKKVSWKRIPQI